MIDEIMTKMEQDETAIKNLKAIVADKDKKIDELKNKLRFYRNEFCLKCGNYREEHLGKCDGCYFRNEWHGDFE